MTKGKGWDDPDCIDRERVRAAVMDGSIRYVAGIGMVTLAKICIWLWPDEQGGDDNQ